MIKNGYYFGYCGKDVYLLYIKLKWFIFIFENVENDYLGWMRMRVMFYKIYGDLINFKSFFFRKRVRIRGF